MTGQNFNEVKDYDYNHLIQHTENLELLNSLERFSRTLKRYGFDVPAYGCLQKLAEISLEKKQQIKGFYDNWLTWIEPTVSEPEIIKIDLAAEKVFLKKALDHHRLWVHDSFWDTLAEGQVIEFYGIDGVQLYRNINFFEFCSYSLLDISIFDWQNLWQRPSQIQEKMNEVAMTVFTRPTPVLKYQVPQHILREIKSAELNEESAAIASLVQFKYAASLFRGLDPRPAGAIATSEAEVIAVGVEAKHIHFV